MSRRRRAALVAVFALALGLMSSSAAFAATISGAAVMGTAGAPFPQSLRMTIVRIDKTGEMAPKPEFVPIAPDGSFSFEGDPALSYLIGTIYQEVTYSTVVAPGELPAKQLKIFETTRDVSAVKITSDSMTVILNKRDPDQFEVLQLLNFENSSDRTYIGEGGEDKTVLKLPVPEAVTDLIPGDPGNPAGLAVTPTGLASTAPLQPGKASIPYLYKVKVRRSGWQLRREVMYPTERVDLLIAEGLALKGAPGFKFAENKTLSDQPYARYRMDTASPGAMVGADIVFPASSTSDGIWYGFGGIAAALATIGALAAVVRRKVRAPERPVRAKTPADEVTREELIVQVARLDESFDAGEVDQHGYDARRARLMDQLKGSP